ncbi:CubicO group peptidase, beta-lactamase class C family [Halogranum amylolyticum]|uniref:CubicO group peptidase, beta-lactamase class C family n=1 Tax=Halogranum amylolyticum TaxID=660520 RepID=A0A1H8UKT5_9EURY|nr:serine hydrolase domain-containing protein [Halogranum amylolyticum]SEP03832.1 CubicO group peptidase, beta-lactamase class C family [Halogranum amylolyticum]
MKHRSIHTAVVLVLVTALVSTPAIATAATPTVRSVDSTDLSDPDEFERWLDETMADQLERHHVPGAAVVVVDDGDILLAKGYGYADLESQRPVVANETVFSIGSTGKLVTWTAVMQGVEDGRLELDRDVNDYLSDSAVSIPATYPEPITLEHLGTHSAGFEDTLDGMVVDEPGKIRPTEEILAEHRPARVRPPGEFVAYSNYGTALAGHVLAEQYDTSFIEYVDGRIFTPLEMDDTTYAQPLPTRLEPRRAIGYTYQNGDYRAHPPLIWTLPPEGGSFRTTGTDMGRFMLAHLNEGTYGSERILEAESVEDMHRRHFTKSRDVPELNGMAYGFIEMDRNGERIVGHWGDTPRFKSLLALFPERDVGLFVVYNAPGGAPARFELLEAFTDRYYPRSDAPLVDPSSGAADRTEALTGDYRSLTISESSWQRILGVTTRTYTVGAINDGYLTTSRLGEGTRRWVERKPGVYEAVGGDEILVFRFDEDGRATHLFQGAFGPATYERVPWYESLTVLQSVLATGVIGFVSVLLLWLGAPLWQRVRDRTAPTRRERLARGLLGVVSLLWLVVLMIFLLALLNLNAEVASPSLALQAGKILRYVALVGTAGSVVATGFVWRDGYWNTGLRVHYMGATLLALLVAWQLYLLRVLPL